MSDPTPVSLGAAIDPGICCRHCLRPIIATAIYVGGLSIKGINSYRWLHKATGTEACPPPEDPPKAAPYDAWEATRRVELVRNARSRAHDAYLDAIEGEPWAEVPR